MSENRVTNGERIAALETRVDNLDKITVALQEDNRSLHELVASVRDMATEIGRMREDQRTIAEKLDGLADRVVANEIAPFKKTASWIDKFKLAIISGVGTVLAGGLVAFIVWIIKTFF